MQPPNRPPPNPRYSRSAQLYERARGVMPGGVNSNYRLGQVPFPLVWARGEGSALWDADGNRYVDHVLGNGSIILGHAHPAVNQAVQASLANGQLYAGQTEAEIHLATEICEMVPCAEMVRVGLSGSEMLQTAIQLSRATTKRPKVVKFEGHYHGWFDNIAVSVFPPGGPPNAPALVPYSKGLPQGTLADVVVLPWNDVAALEACFSSMGKEIACLLLEPIPFNVLLVMPQPGFLERVRELCTANGTVLVFDEVVTGFRLGPGGAQQHFGVTPDLATFGKALGNGVAISAIAGKRDLMAAIADSGMVHAGTHNGNPIGVSAARATLAELRRDGGAAYARVQEHGNLLMEGLRALARDTGAPIQVHGLPAMFQAIFAAGPPVTGLRDAMGRLDHALANRFCIGMLDRGVRILTFKWLLSAAHTREDVDLALATARETWASLSAGS